MAELIGARRLDVVPLVNASAAVNTVLANAPLQRGDLVMTTSTTYNAVSCGVQPGKAAASMQTGPPSRTGLSLCTS